MEFGLDRLTEPQRRALKPILRGQNVLLVAPTGSGKTEAALLPVFSKMVERRPGTGISAIYITPLRALNRDMLRRLEGWGRRLHIEIQVRHGDTPKSVRRKQSLKPPDLLITTPETLQAILPGSRMQRNLKTLRTVIVDEIHQIAENKRGAQLALGLERLRAVVGGDFQRIGLSATVGSPNIAAQLLTGSGSPTKIIQVEVPKSFK
ncbi:MAG: DEAD/DEAH box helicase, partial [Aigarchaeota archaeon]|nr:DEAD/DEAH box helicase [Aigarchaeota archaeon]